MNPERDPTTELCDAVDLLDFNPTLEARLDQRLGHGRCPTGHRDQAGSIHGDLVGGSQQRLQHQRHAHQVGDAFTLDHLPYLNRIEVRHQHRQAALHDVGDEGRKAANVKHRGDQQETVVLVPLQRVAVALGAPEQCLVGESCSLGFARGSGGVHDHRQRGAPFAQANRSVKQPIFHNPLVVACHRRATAECQQARMLCDQPLHGVGEGLFIKQRHRRAITEDITELGPLKTPVQHDRYSPGAGYGEKRTGQELAVLGIHRNPVTHLHPFCHQVVREAVAARIEPGIGQALLCGDDRLSGWGQCSTLCQQAT
ncbi:hypothetical protein D3C85_787760 [compost metagenome]